MKYPLSAGVFSKREPLATAQLWQVRVFAKYLTKQDLLASSFECADHRMQFLREFAQSSFFNAKKHSVANEL